MQNPEEKMVFNCSHCSHSVSVSKKSVGKQGICPQCFQQISIPKESIMLSENSRVSQNIPLESPQLLSLSLTEEERKIFKESKLLKLKKEEIKTFKEKTGNEFPNASLTATPIPNKKDEWELIIIQNKKYILKMKNDTLSIYESPSLQTDNGPRFSLISFLLTAIVATVVVSILLFFRSIFVAFFVALFGIMICSDQFCTSYVLWKKNKPWRRALNNAYLLTFTFAVSIPFFSIYCGALKLVLFRDILSLLLELPPPSYPSEFLMYGLAISFIFLFFLNFALWGILLGVILNFRSEKSDAYLRYLLPTTLLFTFPGLVLFFKLLYLVAGALAVS